MLGALGLRMRDQVASLSGWQGGGEPGAEEGRTRQGNRLGFSERHQGPTAGRCASDC